MESNKRFYWLKLKAEFMTGEVVDALLSQEHGSDFVVIYLQLCTMTINTGGELATKLGDEVIPFTEEKIRQKCQYFDYYTISKAITLFKKLGLIYKQDNGIYKITGFEDMVGSETYWAKRKRKERKASKEKQQSDNVCDNVQSPFISISNSDSVSHSPFKGTDIDDDSEFPF